MESPDTASACSVVGENDNDHRFIEILRPKTLASPLAQSGEAIPTAHRLSRTVAAPDSRPSGQGSTGLPDETHFQDEKTILDNQRPAHGANGDGNFHEASTRSGNGDGLAPGMEAVDDKISTGQSDGGEIVAGHPGGDRAGLGGGTDEPVEGDASSSKMPNQAAHVKVKSASTSLDARTSTYADASSSTEENARTSKADEVPEFSDIWGIASDPVWRPKKFIRNEKYPGVSAIGFYFQDHSGGFVLIRRATNEYAGFYTKLAIKELEEEYGNKQTGKAKSGGGRSRRAG